MSRKRSDVTGGDHLVRRAERRKPMEMWGLRKVAWLMGVCLTLTSCGDFVGPTIAGQVYVLVSVNGEPLPYRAAEGESGAYLELRADTLVFRDADSVTCSTVQIYVLPSEESDWSYTSTKAYEQRPGNRVVITEECPMWSSSCTEDYQESGVVSEDRLVTNRRVLGVEEERVFVRVNGG